MRFLSTLGLSSLLLTSTTAPIVNLDSEFYFNSTNIKQYHMVDDCSETNITFLSYYAELTDDSYIVLLLAQAYFYPLRDHPMIHASLSIAPFRYSYSYSGSLTYYGGQVYKIDAYPKSTSVNYTYTSSVSTDITLSNGVVASFSFSDFSVDVENKGSSIRITSNNSVNYTTSDPRVYSSMKTPENDPYVSAYTWDLEFQKPYEYGTSFNSLVIFELAKNNTTIGEFIDGQFGFFVETCVTTSSFLSTQKDISYKYYYEVRLTH